MIVDPDRQLILAPHPGCDPGERFGDALHARIAPLMTSSPHAASRTTMYGDDR